MTGRRVSYMDSDCWEWEGALHPFGYGHTTLHGKPWLAHRLAWHWEHPDDDMDDPATCVLHACDNRLCVRHLFKGTRLENTADMVSKNRQAVGNRNGSRTMPECRAKGSAHGRSKLVEAQVLEIRDLLCSGMKHKDIASRFGVAESVVSRIKTGARWGHLAQ